MGVKNLNTIIKRYAPQSLSHTAPISAYAGQRIAVDASVYMYKYKSIYGRKWISAFYNFIAMLRDMRCVFVFDRKECIDEKSDERLRRSNQKRQLRERVEQVEAALATYRQSGAVAPVLMSFVATNANQVRLLSGARAMSTFSVEKAEEYIMRSQNHLLPIYREDFETVKSLCVASGIATLDAHMEAEKLCAMLCLEHKVDAIMTEDSDAYVYGTPRILCKVGMGRCTEVCIAQMLAELNMTEKTFVDMCIRCGTDYAPSISGIGPMRAYKSIMTYGSIEAVAASGKYDLSKLNYKRVREIFAHEPSGIDTLVYPESNPTELQRLISVHNIFAR
jgi:5'-3' exonuclease